MVEYHEFGVELLPQVLELYRDAGWTAYLGDSVKLTRAFQASLYVLGAFEGGKLVGFARCLGDGEHTVFVQDLIVAGGFRRQGIGKTLLQKIREVYRHVRTFTLITDTADKRANAFYTAMNMKSYENAGMTGYLW